MGGRKAGIDLHFSDEERRLLKQLAKSSIESILFRKEEEHLDIPANLKEKMGAFVCLKTQGELKGCIGYVRGQLPLDQTVRQMAVEAAFHDPRFMPLNESEWKETDIEISVLTPMKRITDVNEIEVGVHGIYIERGFSSGLLLPQVATENGWDRKAFLEYTCMKAGLPKDAWKSKETDIYIFSADVF
jgi:AmmeMemoRadiSam system protein A